MTDVARSCTAPEVVAALRATGLAAGEPVGTGGGPRWRGMGLAAGDRAFAIRRGRTDGAGRRRTGGDRRRLRRAGSGGPRAVPRPPLLLDALGAARCWDLAAVHRLLQRWAARDEPGAGVGGRARPARRRAARAAASSTCCRRWTRPGRTATRTTRCARTATCAPNGPRRRRPRPLRAARWAALALRVHAAQRAALAGLPDGRRLPRDPALPELTAWAESAADLLAVALTAGGLAAGPRRRRGADRRAGRPARRRPGRRGGATVPPRRRRPRPRAGRCRRRPAQPGSGARAARPDRDRRPRHPVVAAGAAPVGAPRRRRAARLAQGGAHRDDLRLQLAGPPRRAGRPAARRVDRQRRRRGADDRAGRAAQPAGRAAARGRGRAGPRVRARRPRADRAARARRRVRRRGVRRGDPGRRPLLPRRRPDSAATGRPRRWRCSRRCTARRPAPPARRWQGWTAPTRSPCATCGPPRRRAGPAGTCARTAGGWSACGRRRSRPSPRRVAARGRYARNAVVQGSAAELFKMWAVTVRAGLAGTGGEIVLCLHDELLLHVREADAADGERVAPGRTGAVRRDLGRGQLRCGSWSTSRWCDDGRTRRTARAKPARSRVWPASRW